MKPTGRTVLVDLGKSIDQLGADLIVTPDKYKRISNIGTIIEVGDKCVIVSRNDIKKRCIVGSWNRDDCRFNPTQSTGMGLKPHWHFRIPEDKIEALLE